MALPFYNWSRTAASNATADSTVNWAEGQAPSSVNDSARAMMASTAGYRDDVAGALVTAGTSTAYTLTSRQVFDTLAHMDGAALAFTVNATCGASPTLNVDGLGAKTIVASSGNPIAAGLLVINTPYVVTYNNASTEFRLHGVYGVAVSSQNYLTGLTLSTGGSSAIYGVATGTAADSTNASMLALASAYTKTTAAWALGTGNGSLDTGAISNGTWYHAFLIKRIDTGVTDVLLSLSATAPTMPTSYTLFRRLGSLKTIAASPVWTKFSQLGDEFLWDATVNELTNSTPGVTTAQTLTLVGVPTGVKVNALMSASGFPNAGADGRIYFSSFDKTDEALSAQNANIGPVSAVGTAAAGSLNIRTNTSAQVRWRTTTTTASAYAATIGWIDWRGRDG